MILLYAVLHFACIIIAGKKHFQETGSSLGYILGAWLLILGVFIVYLKLQLLTSPLLNNRLGKYSKGLGDYDLLSYASIDDDAAKIEELQKRKMQQGLQISKTYMPITNGVFIAFFICTLLYGFSLISPLILSHIKHSELYLLFRLPAFLIFFIPLLLCLTNKRTIVICPRCGNIHQLSSAFEEFLGISLDNDPRTAGCLKCDYLPSRDRVITIDQ